MRVRGELTACSGTGTPRVLLGIVGYAPVPEAYPLGPDLAARLRADPWIGLSVAVEPMGWGAIHIVQALQADAARYERAVLVGGVQRGGAPGTVAAGHWQGGALAAAALQERIFEAVTGVVSLDNLLAIGEHFGVWPQDVLTVEIELHPAAFGAMVMAAGARGEDRGAAARDALGFDPAATIAAAAALATQLVRLGTAAPVRIAPRTAATLGAIGRLSAVDVVAGQPGEGRRTGP